MEQNFNEGAQPISEQVSNTLADFLSAVQQSGGIYLLDSDNTRTSNSCIIRVIILFFCALYGGLASYAASFGVVINEIMQSNVDCLFVDNNFPDSWVELYNYNAEEINLTGFSIGECSNRERAWKLQGDIIIPSLGYLVIYCDKKADGLHTDFQLDLGKGELYLFDTEGRIVDQLYYEEMPAPNIAYGRMSDGNEEWCYENHSTPGMANDGERGYDIAPDPIFSQEGNIIYSPFRLEITMPADCPSDALIYWTKDGSEPNTNSPNGSKIRIDINANTVIRAKIISKDYLIPRSVTHSYIFDRSSSSEVFHKGPFLPVFSLVTSEEYFYDDNIGIMSGDKDNSNANYLQNWRRPLNIEFFMPDSIIYNQYSMVFNQSGETSIDGDRASRSFAQKSLRLYANERFGTKLFDYPFWSEKHENSKYASLMLRNGGERCAGSRTNDAFVQRLFGTHIDNLDWQAYRPVVVYLNGYPKGLFELREPLDEHFIEANYGYDDSNIYRAVNLFYGEGTFDELVKLIWSKSSSYDEISNLLDIDELINYLIAEAYCGNKNWPENNIFAWAPKSENGRWRWVLKDLDEYRFYPNDKNFLNYMFVEGAEGQEVKSKGKENCHKFFIRLNSFEEFRNEFINRFSAYLGDFLKPSYACTMLSEMSREIDEEMHYTYYDYPISSIGSFSWYRYEQEAMMEYTKERAAAMYRNLSETFSLGKVIPTTIETKGMKVNVNGVTLLEGDFEGAFFRNRAATIEADSAKEGWIMTLTLPDGSQNDYRLSSSSVCIDLSNYPECDSVLIRPYASSDNAIFELTAEDDSDEASCYDLFGRSVSHATTGRIMIYKGKKIIIKGIQ